MSCNLPNRGEEVLSVKSRGALGDGRTDDTQAIQAALDDMRGKNGTVIVPPGKYMIDATRGLRVGSRTTVKLEKGAILKAFPNDKDAYSLLWVSNVTDVVITGGILDGEREEHQGTSGQWGMGIRIGGSHDIIIHSVLAQNMWGDGFYINNRSQNIRFCEVVADRNRRQGLSIVSADGVEISHSTFKNTGGIGPESGIDIEPNEGDSVRNVRISDSFFLDNKGHGIVAVVTSKLKKASISDVIIERNVVRGNQKVGIGLYNTSKNIVTDNDTTGQKNKGILLHRTASSNIVKGNRALKNGIIDNGKNDITQNFLQ